jgi:flavin reductase (DIM6/NTAB) family NADH-FMN oxidoreductase RutF
MTFQLIPIGRHTLVLGEVVGMHIRDELMLDPAKQYVDTPGLHLVGRMHGRGWYARTTDLVDVPRITAAEWLAGKEEK